MLSLSFLLALQLPVAEPVLVRDALVSTAPGSPTPNVRIPGLAVTSGGTLLLFAEGRIGAVDPGGEHPIALVMVRSTDGGESWSAPTLIASDPAFDFANPTPVVDRHTGVIWLGYDRFPDRCGSNADCNTPGNDPADSNSVQTVWVRASHDDGATLGEPVLLPKPVRTDDGIWWRSAAVGPGSGIQLDQQRDPSRNGRLVIPGRRIGSRSMDGAGEGGEPFVFISDDHGVTWQLGGVTAGAGANEPEIVELADGRLLMDARQNVGRHRWRWWSDDGGATWGKPLPGDIAITPVDASVVRIADGRLAFTGPTGPGRHNLGLWLSDDGGVSFRLAGIVADGHAAYSVVQPMPDGDLAVVYEATPASTIRFVRVQLRD
ncbi:MAG: sialidase family protein [Gemmatimonadales bacterium]|nr:sialidase family protein [Gemmatimonadales bacterium]MDZ4390284.1 sialidase family protein [Gemmatimonadales bacterium]